RNSQPKGAGIFKLELVALLAAIEFSSDSERILSTAHQQICQAPFASIPQPSPASRQACLCVFQRLEKVLDGDATRKMRGPSLVFTARGGPQAAILSMSISYAVFCLKK